MILNVVFAGFDAACQKYFLQSLGFYYDFLLLFSGMHICDPRHPDHAGEKQGCCTMTNPCPLHIGDCNIDEECKGDLLCNLEDQGLVFGYFHELVDVCGESNIIIDISLQYL